MTTRMHTVSSNSIVGRNALAVVVVTGSFIAGAMFQGPRWPYDTSAAFAQPARAAQSDLQTPAPITELIAPVRTDWGRSGDEQIFEPRECDLPKGISIACLFMD